MALAELVMYTALGGAGSGAMACGMVWLSNLRDKLAKKKAEAEKVDGRTAKEWYDILKSMGREDYERFSRGVLDGLEESDKYGKWDIKPLLKEYYDTLMYEWYPEKYCKYCRKQNCNQQCDAYWAGVPGCKGCRRIRSGDRCPGCGYYDPIWQRTSIRTKSERAKEVEYSIDQALGVIKIKKPQVQYNIPKPPPRAAITTGSKEKGYVHLTSDGMTYTKHDIKIVMVSQPGTSERVYQIMRNGRVWTADKAIIETFQRTKGLIPSGLVDDETRDAIIRYLDAGNAWPVHPQRKKLTMSELERVNRDLAKWKNDHEWEPNW